jgi:hypothetical protein
MRRAGQYFGAVGDGASDDFKSQNVNDLVGSWNPNLFLYLGDVCDRGGASGFSNWYGTNGSFFSRFAAITDPTIGNHEYIQGSSYGYFAYWGLGTRHYYSFDAGGWHFIRLDSTSQFRQTAPNSPQYQWLNGDLQANPNPCTIVFYHQPLYNVGSGAAAIWMQDMWSLFAQYGVPIVLNGHDYQRWLPLHGTGNPSANGVTELVIGTGGHSGQEFTRTDPRLAFGIDNSVPNPFRALQLQLGPTSASFQYVKAGGVVMDSGTIPCGGVSAGA